MKAFFLFVLVMFNNSLLFGQDSIVDPNTFIYNNGIDTLFLSKPQFRGLSQTSLRIYDTIQIDGKGLKEVIFSRSFAGSISEHGGTFDIEEYLSYHAFEIWNLDTKEQLFEIKNHYFHQYNRFIMQGSKLRQKGSIFYGYDFKISEEGVVTVFDLNLTTDLTLPFLNNKVKKDGSKLDLEGSYYFNGNKYVKTE